MQIGNMDDFRQQQLGKVEKRKKEDERIRKGVYQMHAMIEAQSTETFFKECDKTEKQPEQEKSETEKAEAKKDGRKTDVKTEIEKMLSVGARFANLNSQTV
ncbi:MAG: hypothetical protein K2H52_15615 [Lachnospiraceae bacterium]|nr:hypothetical protein [Lachnospiraceae bacterium]MDE6183938.1 hypothetical protein [Lachnospiraceae bacterium]